MPFEEIPDDLARIEVAAGLPDGALAVTPNAVDTSASSRHDEQRSTVPERLESR